MKQKLFVLGLSLMILFVQVPFVFSQTAVRSTDEMAAMLDEPEVAAAINVKKIVSEIAPSIFNNDAETMKTLAASMKMIEDQTGVNPYALDKIVFGLKFSQTDEDLLIVMQSDSSAKIAENMYQNKLAAVNLANLVNPLQQKIFWIKHRIEMEPMYSETESASQAIREGIAAKLDLIKSMQTELNGLKPSAANQPSIDGLKSDLQKAGETLAKIKENYDLWDVPTEFSSRAARLEEQIKAISPNDPQMAAKTGEIGKNLPLLERDFANYRSNYADLRNSLADGLMSKPVHGTPPAAISNLEKAEKTLKTLPAAEPRRTASLHAAQKLLADEVARLDKMLTSVNPANMPVKPAPDSVEPGNGSDDSEVEVYPKTTEASRKEEIVEGKKVFILTTVEKYTDGRPDAIIESALGLADDKILLFGDHDSVVKSLTGKNANRNQTARTLLAKSPDALVALGVDLQNADFKDFYKVLGETQNSWQAYGSLTSAGNDLTLDAVVEKSDRPSKSPVKKDETETTKAADKNITATVTDIPAATNPALDNLIFLLIKSIVGVEGKISLRFEKKKAAAMLGQTPQVLRRLLNGEVSSQKQSGK